MKRAFITVGLTFGDEGKGTIVESLVRTHKAPLVVRYSGGSQCAHNVLSIDGFYHKFAIFGSGTHHGAATVLTKDVLVDPVRLMNEGFELEKKGVNAFDKKMFIDANALVITPFHRALNRIKEIARGKEGRHGSCGVGIGETASYALKHKDAALTIGDLFDANVATDKLYFMRDELIKEVTPLAEQNWMKAGMQPEISAFTDTNLIDAMLWRYHVFLDHVSVLKTHGVLEMIAKNDTVWEPAQGTLLDEDYGFHPYTTWSHVSILKGVEVCKEAGITEITKIGVARAFAHRHGAGPFPSEDPNMLSEVDEKHNKLDDWQGDFRVGFLDLPMLRYSAEINQVDEVAITHFDIIDKRPSWDVVTEYPFEIKKLPVDDFAAREAQTNALMALNLETAGLQKFKFNSNSIEALITNIVTPNDKTNKALIISRGPFHESKIYRK